MSDSVIILSDSDDDIPTQAPYEKTKEPDLAHLNYSNDFSDSIIYSYARLCQNYYKDELNQALALYTEYFPTTTDPAQCTRTPSVLLKAMGIPYEHTPTSGPNQRMFRSIAKARKGPSQLVCVAGDGPTVEAAATAACLHLIFKWLKLNYTYTLSPTKRIASHKQQLESSSGTVMKPVQDGPIVRRHNEVESNNNQDPRLLARPADPRILNSAKSVTHSQSTGGLTTSDKSTCSQTSGGPKVSTQSTSIPTSSAHDTLSVLFRQQTRSACSVKESVSTNYLRNSNESSNEPTRNPIASESSHSSNRQQGTERDSTAFVPASSSYSIKPVINSNPINSSGNVGWTNQPSGTDSAHTLNSQTSARISMSIELDTESDIESDIELDNTQVGSAIPSSNINDTIPDPLQTKTPTEPQILVVEPDHHQDSSAPTYFACNSLDTFKTEKINIFAMNMDLHMDHWSMQYIIDRYISDRGDPTKRPQFVEWQRDPVHWVVSMVKSQDPDNAELQGLSNEAFLKQRGFYVIIPHGYRYFLLAGKQDESGVDVDTNVVYGDGQTRLDAFVNCSFHAFVFWCETLPMNYNSSSSS